MAKISNHDTTKESIQIQEFIKEVRDLLNNGSIEIETTTASQPAYDAPTETRIVLSIFGTQYRIYFSYLGDWYHATLTKI